MGHLIERGMDAPHQPRLLGDRPIFKAGRLVGVERRIHRYPVPAKPNCEFRVLVIDDTRDMADLCSDCLRSWGFRVATAYGGVAGLDAAQNTVPDLILLNYLMPGLSGLQVMQLLHAHSKTARIKVIIHDVESIGELAFRMGADDFLLLPFKPEVLLDKVSRAVRS